MLLDEPFSALDRDLRAQLTTLVRELVAELGVPLVHVTHSVAEARQLADQVIRIEKGKIVARGTPPRCSRASRLSTSSQDVIGPGMSPRQP